MIKNFLLLITIFFSTLQISAYAEGPKGNTSLADDSMRDLLIVGGTGTMGAILGLSTLSFVDEPSEHLKNVYMGASLGVILGVSFVAYVTANKEQEMLTTLKNSVKSMGSSFSTRERLVWHEEGSDRLPNDHTKHKWVDLKFRF